MLALDQPKRSATSGFLDWNLADFHGSSTRISLVLREHGHTIQAEVFGVFFLPFYLRSGGLPDNNHPFELVANEYARGGSAIP